MALRNGADDAALGSLYPFQDESFVLRDGQGMHYIRMGRPGVRRPTFLLLHGNPTWSLLWRRFVRPLSRIGQVIVPDHIGYGRSDHPTDPDDYSLDGHVHNLEELASHLRLKRVIPVVHDWGGPIGLGYATRHKEDLAGLVLMNTWAFTERERVRPPAWYRALGSRVAGRTLLQRRNTFVDTIMPRLNVRPIPEEVMEGYRHPFPTAQSRAAILAAVRMVPTKPDHPDWPTLDAIEKALPGLDVPAAILWGTEDPAFGMRFARAFHDLLPQAEEPQRFAAGHYLQEDVPDELIAAIEAFAKRI